MFYELPAWTKFLLSQTLNSSSVRWLRPVYPAANLFKPGGTQSLRIYKFCNETGQGSQFNGKMDACSYLCRREGLAARKICSQSAHKWFWPPLAEHILDYTGRRWSRLPLCCHHSGSHSEESLGHCRKWQWKLKSIKKKYIFSTDLRNFSLYLSCFVKKWSILFSATFNVLHFILKLQSSFIICHWFTWNTSASSLNT